MKRSDERGAVLVEAPLATCIFLLLAMGITTLVQLAWTHLALSSAVQSSTRYATHVDYDPALGTIDRHRTEAMVEDWAMEVAAEAHVDREDVHIVGRHLPSEIEAPIAELIAGDEIIVTIDTEVSNALYRLAASVTNTAASVLGAGPVFHTEGIRVRAEAVTYVE